MRTVLVRGADGERAELVFVRKGGGTVYVCSKANASKALAGDDDPVVGFPESDVEDVRSA